MSKTYLVHVHILAMSFVKWQAVMNGIIIHCRRALAYVVDKSSDRERLTEVTSRVECETAGRRKERQSPELQLHLTSTELSSYFININVLP